jgi:hypothetical protein
VDSISPVHPLSDAPTVTRTASRARPNTADKAFDSNLATYWSPADLTPSAPSNSRRGAARRRGRDRAAFSSSSIKGGDAFQCRWRGDRIADGVVPERQRQPVAVVRRFQAPTRILVDFDGETVHIAETPAAARPRRTSNARDLVFVGTASVDVSVAKFDGDAHRLQRHVFRFGGQRLATRISGRLFAPVPETVTLMTVSPAERDGPAVPRRATPSISSPTKPPSQPGPADYHGERHSVRRRRGDDPTSVT